MGNIYCVGEAVYDIIFKNNIPVESRPGGAMFNSAISLGRIGLPVYFVGDFADDHVGKLCSNFLRENGVNTNFVTLYPGARSRIALAFLDEHKNAEYSFYKISDCMPRVRFPVPQKGDIILYGSWFSIKPAIRPQLAQFLEDARQAGALLLYDPNFRKAHLDMLETVRPFIDDNIRFSHITKGSDEDFHYILDTSDVSKIHQYAEHMGCRHLIYTANRNGAWLFCNDETRHFPALKIKPVSTVGAGDSFNAGILYGLYKLQISPDNFSEMSNEQWDFVMQQAINFASEVCMSFDNYISPDFAKSLDQS
jgi:fructokinase